MRIERVDIVPFTPPFTDGGYVMSHVTQVRLNARLLRLVTDSGTWGIGEILRRATLDPDIAMAAEDRHLPELTGLPLSDLPALLTEWRKNLSLRGLCYALDLAHLDLTARAMNVPLHATLGSARQTSVPAYRSLSADAAEAMAGAVRAGSEHSVIQIKLGVTDPDTDIACIKSVLAVLRPDQRLLADYNGALDVETASRVVQSVRDDRLIWEDPCLSYEDNATVAATGVPVMLDMCLEDVPAFSRAIRDGWAAALAIKPPFLGGLTVARTARDLCSASGVPLRVDGPWSGQIGAAAAIHLALGAPPDLLVCAADLTAPLTTDRSLIRYPAPGTVGVADGAGLGPMPALPFQTEDAA